MQTFWELFRQSMIIQGLLALGCTFTISGLLMYRVPVPAELWALEGLIMGYFFGAKNVATTTESLRQIQRLINTSGE